MAVDAVFRQIYQQILDNREFVQNAKASTAASQGLDKAVQGATDGQIKYNAAQDQFVADSGEVISRTKAITAAKNQQNKAQRTGNFALLNFNQVLQDSGQFQFGFRQGIQATMNNVQGLAQAIGMTIEQNRGLNNSWKDMLKNIGTGGWIMLAMSAVTIAYTIFAAATKDSKEEQEGLNEAMREFIKLTGENLEGLEIERDFAEDLLRASRERLKILEKEESLGRSLGARGAGGAPGAAGSSADALIRLNREEDITAEKEVQLALEAEIAEIDKKLLARQRLEALPGMKEYRQEQEAIAQAQEDELEDQKRLLALLEKKKKTSKEESKAAADRLKLLRAAITERDRLLVLAQKQVAAARKVTKAEEEEWKAYVDGVERKIEALQRFEKFRKESIDFVTSPRTPTDPASGSLTSAADDAFTAVILDQIEAAQRFKEEVVGVFVDGYGEMADAFAAFVFDSSSDRNFLTLLLPLVNLAENVGKIAIAIGVGVAGIKESLKTLNPVVAIAAGVALLTLAKFAKSALSNAIDNAGSGDADLSRFQGGGIGSGQGVYGLSSNTGTNRGTPFGATGVGVSFGAGRAAAPVGSAAFIAGAPGGVVTHRFVFEPAVASGDVMYWTVAQKETELRNSRRTTPFRG